MDIENQEIISCNDDGEYRVYCDTHDNLCVERFYKNNLKSQPHPNNTYKRQRLNITIKNN